MKILLLIVFSFFLAFPASAQTKISGTVRSAKGKPVANANVILKNTYDGASADSTGKFSFSTDEKGKQLLIISGLNYETDSIALTLSGEVLNLNIVVREAENVLNTVTINAGSFVAGDSKKGAILTSVEIATTAGARADIFAALQTLPGAQTNFSESGLFVRGGAAAETKTYFDGMLVKSPFNATVPNQAARGRLSAFLFKGTSFSAGGYSAQYGQALSSALILESTDLPEKTTTGISLLSLGGGIDQNVRFKNSALSLSSFYYNLAPVYHFFKQQHSYIKAPELTGGTVQYKAKTSENGMFKFYASYGYTDLSLNQTTIDDPASPSFFSNRNKDLYVNSTYKEYLSDTWKLEAGLAYNTDTDRGLMTVNNYERTDHLAEGRFTLTHFFGRRSNFKFGTESFGTGRAESFNGLSRKYTDQLSSVFAETDWFITGKVVARLGIRSEYSSYLKKYNLAPRTSLGLKTSTHSQVSMAYGRFFQNPEDEFLILKPLDFERADHYILKYELNNPSQNFRVEGFHKDYKSLTKISGSVPDNSGYGYAKGLDVFWRDKKSIKNVDYRVSYSYLDTRRNMRDFPMTATPRFAAKHTFNAVYSQFISRIQSQVGLAYTYASGRPYYNPNNPVYLADRTKSFNSLSATLSYLTHIFKQFTVVYVNANNIPGFNNIYGYQYSTDGMNRKPIVPSAKRDVFIGLLMTIGDDTFVR